MRFRQHGNPHLALGRSDAGFIRAFLFHWLFPRPLFLLPFPDFLPFHFGVLPVFVSETQGGMRGTSRVSDFFEEGNPTICDKFVAELNNYLNNQKVKDSFRAVFPNFDFDSTITRKKIEEIKGTYISERQKLEDAYNVANNENPKDEYKIKSIRHQILRMRNELLIGYLAEKQFIPNANMPTSVVEFDHTTVEDLRRKNNILDETCHYSFSRSKGGVE